MWLLAAQLDLAGSHQWVSALPKAIFSPSQEPLDLGQLWTFFCAEHLYKASQQKLFSPGLQRVKQQL